MKRIAALVAIFIFSISLSYSFALPEGGTVESGSASFEQTNPTTLNIITDDKTVINFLSFNIAPSESVNFIQPSAFSSVLSRITGPGSTEIAGLLSANGILFLINPFGINFSSTASVQVNTLVASTLDITTNNFIKGNYLLQRNGEGKQIFNQGAITANNIALIANSIDNSGVIQATVGVVHLASGDKTTVSFDTQGLIQVEINEKTAVQVLDSSGIAVKDAIANSGKIQAAQVVMTSRAAADIFENAVNQQGLVKATGLVTDASGAIKIVTDNNIRIAGALEAEKGNILVTSDKDILVKADLTCRSGDIKLLADADSDGSGEFHQQSGLIQALGQGNIYIDGSQTMTLGKISAEEGFIKIGSLKAPEKILGSSSTPLTANYLLLISKNFLVNSAALTTHVFKNDGDIYIMDSSSAGDLTTLQGDDLGKITYLSKNNLILQTDYNVRASPAVIINANSLKLISQKFGSINAPLNLKANTIHINRIGSGIEILESLGLGTSIMLRGPPDDFGAIIYNQNSRLILEANQVKLSGEAPTYFYGDITFYNFTCTVPDKEIYFEPGKTYTFLELLTILGSPDVYPEEYHIKLRSQIPGEYWHLSVQTTDYQLNRVFVSDCFSLSPLFIPIGVDAGHNYNLKIDPVWDGEGATNYWSDRFNWSGDAIPGAGSDVMFDGTSSKISYIDTNSGGGTFDGTIASLTIDGYAGTITMQRSLTVTGAVAFTSGAFTFTTGGNTLAMDSFSQSAGAFTASASSITCNGDFSLSNGTFNADTSTLTLDATSADLNFSANGFTLRNVIFKSSSADTRTITLGTGTITMSGNFYVEAAGNGNLEVDASFNNPSLSISGDLDFTGSGSGTESISMGSGEWNMAGVSADIDLRGGTIDAGTSTLRFTSLSTQTIYGNSQTFYAVSTSAYVWVYSDFSVSSSMTVNSDGYFRLYSGNITMLAGSVATINGIILDNYMLELKDSAATLLSGSGTLSCKVRFNAVDSDVTVPALTYEGIVEFYNNGGVSRTFTLGTVAGQTIAFGTFNPMAQGAGNTVVDAATYNPTININGDLDFTGTGGGSESILMGSGTWNIKGNINLSGGTISAGSSTVVMDSSSWTSIGSGIETYVEALVVYDGKLIAGGWFTTAGNYIAQWDGASWSALGTGMNGIVYTLAVYDNKLIAGGAFTTAGGNAANRIAQWDGASWSALGTGMESTVSALTMYDNKLIAAGGFTTAGGVAVNYIAQWDGASWSALGSGLNSGAGALCVYDNKLIVGGGFSTAGGNSAIRIAQWNGASWSALGSGVGSSVQALIVYNNELIAGGAFTTAGGISANKIAKWNGSSWSALGSGFDNTVQSLEVYNNELIVGGMFDFSGEVSANSIMRWDGSLWHTIGCGLSSTSSDTYVQALVTYNADLVAGGSFTRTGSTSINRVAKQTYATLTTTAQTFNNLVIENTAGFAQGVIVSGNLNVSGDLSIEATSGGNAVLDCATNNPTVTVDGDIDFIGAGAGTETVSMGSGSWTVEGDVDLRDGSVTAGASTLIMNGASTQDLYANGQSLNTLTTQNAAGVTVSGDCQFNNINVDSGSLAFAAGSTYTITNTGGITVDIGAILDLSGGGPEDLVTLRSDSPSDAWDLTNNGIINADWIDIQDCNSASPLTVTNSANTGGNTNITFGSGSLRYWIAAGTADWNNIANWALTSGGIGGASVPGSSNNAIFDGNGLGSCNIDIPVSIDSLYILSTYTTGTVGINAGQSLTVSGSFNLAAGTFNTNNNALTVSSYAQTGGIFNAGSSSIECSGDWSSSGTFNAGSSTVTFDTTATSIISGATTFNNFTCATAGKTLNFASGSTQAVQGAFTITGASGNLITLGRSGGVLPDDQWNINVSGTSSVSYVSVSNSKASGNTITPTNSTNGGNNTNWSFGKAFSGTVYSDNGITPIGANVTVAVAVNGAAAASTTQTNANGQYTFNNIAVSDGDIVIFYLDGQSQEGCAVTVVAYADLSGVDIYQNQIIVRHDYTTGYTTNVNLAAADNADPDIPYSVSGNNLLLESGDELYIWPGDTYQPGGNINAAKVNIQGNLNLGASSITINGNLVAASTGKILGTNPTLSVDGYLGTKDNPVTTDISGRLTVSAKSMQDYVSVALKGTGEYSFNEPIPGFVISRGQIQDKIGQQNFRASLISAENSLYRQIPHLPNLPLPSFLPALPIIFAGPLIAPLPVITIPLPSPTLAFSGITAASTLPSLITKTSFTGIASQAYLPLPLTKSDFKDISVNVILPAPLPKIPPIPKSSFRGITATPIFPEPITRKDFRRVNAALKLNLAGTALPEDFTGIISRVAFSQPVPKSYFGGIAAHLSLSPILQDFAGITAQFNLALLPKRYFKGIESRAILPLSLSREDFSGAISQAFLPKPIPIVKPLPKSYFEGITYEIILPKRINRNDFSGISASAALPLPLFKAPSITKSDFKEMSASAILPERINYKDFSGISASSALPLPLSKTPSITKSDFKGMTASAILPAPMPRIIIISSSDFKGITASVTLPKLLTLQIFSGIKADLTLNLSPLPVTAEDFKHVFTKSWLPKPLPIPSFGGISAQAILPPPAMPEPKKAALSQPSFKGASVRWILSKKIDPSLEFKGLTSQVMLPAVKPVPQLKIPPIPKPSFQGIKVKAIMPKPIRITPAIFKGITCSINMSFPVTFYDFKKITCRLILPKPLPIPAGAKPKPAFKSQPAYKKITSITKQPMETVMQNFKGIKARLILPKPNILPVLKPIASLPKLIGLNDFKGVKITAILPRPLKQWGFSGITCRVFMTSVKQIPGFSGITCRVTLAKPSDYFVFRNAMSQVQMKIVVPQGEKIISLPISKIR